MRSESTSSIGLHVENSYACGDNSVDLSIASICKTRYGNEWLYSVSLEWSNHVNFYAVVGVQQPFRKFFWRAKSSDHTYLGLGCLIAESSTNNPRFQAFADQRWVLSVPFDQGIESELHYYLPELEVEKGPSSQSLTVRMLLHGETISERDLMASTRKTLDRYLQHLSANDLPDLPALTGAEDQPSARAWRQMVDEAKDAIGQCLLDKLVLSRLKRLTCANTVNAGRLLQRLSLNEEDSYLFALVKESGRAFVGRSPERLLSWTEDHFEVDAIAGTRQLDTAQSELRDDSHESQLRSSTKDLNEHRYVSDYVEAVLKAFSPHVVRTESEQILKLKYMQHIRTCFSARRVPSHSPFELLAQLHPTPAVGGTPPQKALSLIGQIEASKRGLFAGSIGYGSQKCGDVAIGIRTAWVEGNAMDVFAGAGIVEGSDPQREWEETELKMKNFLSLFS